MNNPLVSICTASYNHGKFLEDYFEGIINQTYRPLQLIFICDDSPDDTWQQIPRWIVDLQKANVRSRFVKKYKNTGAFESFDEAFSRSSGDYICTLESDDFYLPTKIEESVKFLTENPQFSAMHTEINSLWEDGRYEENSWRVLGRNRSNETTFEDLLVDNSIYTCTFMMKREVMEKAPKYKTWQDRGYMMADYPHCLWIAKYFKIGYLDKNLSTYRLHSGGASKDPNTHGKFVQSYLQIKQDARSGLI